MWCIDKLLSQLTMWCIDKLLSKLTMWCIDKLLLVAVNHVY